MIQITCPGCGSKLNAKDELVGQTRNCPQCKTPVLIVAPPPAPVSGDLPLDETVVAFSPESDTISVATEGLPSQHFLDKLNRHHYYLVVDPGRVIAVWENNGHGWQIKTHTGLVSAARNQQLLPAAGSFRLVELQLEHVESGTRLLGLICYKLAERWALNALTRGDDVIAERIVGHAGLNRDQKTAVRNALKERFMGDVWHNAANVTEYLGNNDFHSPGTPAD